MSSKKSKFVIVTGATRGLGLGCVQSLLSSGHRVLATGRDSSVVKGKLPESLHENLICENLDVSDDKSMFDFEKRLPSLTDRIDVLVNNAGIFLDSKTDPTSFSTSHEDFLKTLAVNVAGPYRMIQIVLPWMRRQEFGRIVNVSSGMGQLSEMGSGSPGYRSSKAALNALTLNLSTELEGSNVLINSVCPGWVRTDMGGENAVRALDEGVSSILHAAFLTPDSEPAQGTFTRDGKLLRF